MDSFYSIARLNEIKIEDSIQMSPYDNAIMNVSTRMKLVLIVFNWNVFGTSQKPYSSINRSHHIGEIYDAIIEMLTAHYSAKKNTPIEQNLHR